MIQTVILLQHRPRRIHQMIPVQVILQIPDSNNANPTSTSSADNNSDPDDNDTDPTNLRFRRQRVISECPLMIWKVQLAQHSFG